MKSKFPLRNVKEFISDSVLWTNYKKYPTIKNKMLDTTISSGDKYLYSWQDRDSSKNEFTVILDDGELGLKIFYIILDRQDNFLSSTQIAGKGSEGGYWFGTTSTFLSADTLLNIGAITKWYDEKTNAPLRQTKGDTTFAKMYIDKYGKFNITQTRKHFEIDFEKNVMGR
jgi:hypothetical protein